MVRVLEPGFDMAQTDNLPKVDSICMTTFLAENPDFVGAEIRGVKNKRAGRESYGDNAIGHVQVKREGSICIVKARVTPEHNVRKQPYAVTLVCREANEEIISVQCADCAASSGGCKHAIALLTWLHRRSEEPPATSTVCYWKKSTMSTLGTTLRFVKASDIGRRRSRSRPMQVDDQTKKDFLESVMQATTASNAPTVLGTYLVPKTPVEKLSVHYMLQEFFNTPNASTLQPQDFLAFTHSKTNETLCREAHEKTIGQSDSALWRELRYGRITASKIHEVVHCKKDGVLVEGVMGALTKDTTAMRRGRDLEKKVRKVLAKEMNIPIKDCGLMIDHLNPIVGASADGITEDYVIEIKCPKFSRTVSHYIADNKVQQRYFAQIQLQMFLHRKEKGVFCVADPEFETNKKIQVVIVDLEETYCKDMIEKSVKFWNDMLFPKLKSNFV